jgi:hypothetical protein
LLTVTRTCQLQRINVLAYLTAAIHCRRGGQVVASLLPKRRTPELLQRCQLDRLYQRVVNDLDQLLDAVGLKAAA